MNKQLSNLYKTHTTRLFNINLQTTKEIHGPFLVSASEKYKQSNLKVAFVGQETNGWTCHQTIEEQMQTYTRFNYGKKYYASPFWNVIRKIEKNLNIESYSSMWLNLNRYDENNKRPSKKNRTQLQMLDTILYEELKILQPNVIIWFTGPSYDKRVKDLLKATSEKTTEFSNRQLSRFHSEKLPCLIFRTYHPNYLRRSGLEKRVISYIVQNIKS